MIKKRKNYWIAGTLISLIGVCMVRLLSLSVTGNTKIAVLLAGYTLGIVGLFIITLGTRRM